MFAFFVGVIKKRTLYWKELVSCHGSWIVDKNKRKMQESRHEWGDPARRKLVGEPWPCPVGPLRQVASQRQYSQLTLRLVGGQQANEHTSRGHKSPTKRREEKRKRRQREEEKKTRRHRERSHSHRVLVRVDRGSMALLGRRIAQGGADGGHRRGDRGVVRIALAALLGVDQLSVDRDLKVARDGRRALWGEEGERERDMSNVISIPNWF